LGSAAWKALLIIHRYLGVAVGLLMVLWCLSGFVMMYQGYPQLAEAERLQGLQPLRLATPCDPARLGLASGIPVTGFTVEMLAGAPQLHVRLQDAAHATLDLSTCERAGRVDPQKAKAVALAFASGHGVAQPAKDRGEIAYDQWTIQGAGSRGPVRHFSFDDPARTDLYVASHSGEAVQRTTRTQRVLGWLGAVPHWLYPTLLRRDSALWEQVVIWTSLIGVFLTGTGLYVGIARLRRYKSGRWSPYRGWFFWHHMTGLVFGLVTLTWVGSGLLTMSPWGLLDSPALGHWRAMTATAFPSEQLSRFLHYAEPSSEVVQYQAAPLDGELFVLAHARNGAITRLDAEARPSPLAPEALEAQIRAKAHTPVRSFEWMEREDAYYYAGFERPAPLPVLRAVLDDKERTTLYLDPVSGKVLRAVDNGERASRWMRVGLHDWDFPGLRTRPVWDVVVLLLLGGTTAVCVIGAWLSLRRVGLDVAALHRRLRRRR
jgi:hypothetical protein